MNNRAEITAVSERFVAAFSRGDAVGMAACYTENSMVMSPNKDFITGRAEIQKHFQGRVDTGIMKAIKFETVELEEHGDIAYEVGKLTVFDTNDKIVFTGKYLDIWKQEGGPWKLHRDIANSSMPRQ